MASTPHDGSAAAFDVQGHRGARGLLPENTIPAFIKALDCGVRTLEMDVVISGDQQVVVSHDPWMSSQICSLPSGEPVPPGEEDRHRLFGMSYDEIKQYDCGRRGHPQFPRQQRQPAVKPLLREVIEAAEQHASETGRPLPFYNIETKSQVIWEQRFHPDPRTFTRRVCEAVDAAGTMDRTILQSFDVRTLRVGRDLDAGWTLSLLVEHALEMERQLEELGFVPSIYSPNHHLVDRHLIDKARAYDMQVIPWTVNTLEEMRELKALGVAGLITDYPDLGVELMGGTCSG